LSSLLGAYDDGTIEVHAKSPSTCSCGCGGEAMLQTCRQHSSITHTASQAGVHTVRHTFCSHLAMRGAPPRAIQELAGHKDLSMTQRYMHLSPAALDAAIRILEQPAGPVQPGRFVQNRGNPGGDGPRGGEKDQ